MSEVVFVCMSCRKRSYDAYGEFPIDCVWERECSRYAVPCRAEFLVLEDGRVREIMPGGILDVQSAAEVAVEVAT